MCQVAGREWDHDHWRCRYWVAAKDRKKIRAQHVHIQPGPIHGTVASSLPQEGEPRAVPSLCLAGERVPGLGAQVPDPESSLGFNTIPGSSQKSDNMTKGVRDMFGTALE